MNITLTMFSNENEKIETMYQWIKENIKYEKMSIGIHKNATRPHVHYGLTKIEKPNVKHLRLYYNKKGLKEVHPDIKLSVHENANEEDCKKCLGYPLKEYEKIEDIKYRQYINIDDQELEGYRVFAHGVYRAANYIKNNKEEKKEAGNNRMLSLEDYVTKKIETEMMTEEKIMKKEFDDPAKCYVEIFNMVCEYSHEEEDKITWRWTDIANYSYSKMYRLAREQSNLNRRAIIRFQQKIKYKE